VSHGVSCPQAQRSIPTLRRLPPLPWRTRIAPLPASRSHSANAGRFADPQTSSPQHDDQAAQPGPIRVITGGAHHGDDLLDGRRVSGIPQALVAWRATR